MTIPNKDLKSQFVQPIQWIWSELQVFHKCQSQVWLSIKEHLQFSLGTGYVAAMGPASPRLPASRVSVQFSPVPLHSFPIRLLSPNLDSRAGWLRSAPHNGASLRESLMGKNNVYHLSTHLCLWHCQIWGSVSLLFCSQCQWMAGPSLGLPYSWVFSSHSVSQVNFLFKT